MTLEEAQKRAIHLARLAANVPATEEGRTAAAKACSLIAQHGLLIVKPSDLPKRDSAAAAAGAVRAAAESGARAAASIDPERVATTVRNVADIAVTGLETATSIASAWSGFRDATRGRRRR